MAQEPKTGLEYWPSGAIQQDVLFNALLLRFAAVGGQPSVLDKDLATPPAHVAGNAYIIASSPTGVWAGRAGQIAYSDGVNWSFFTPAEGWRVAVLDEDTDYRYNGTAWVNAGGATVTSVNGQTGAVTITGANVAEPVNALTISSGAVNINCALGDYFTLTLTANVTSITFSNLPAAGFAQTIMVQITQDGTGGRTVTWPSAFDWASGTVPAVTATANAKDVLAITTFDQGTSWEATLSKAHA